MKKITAWIIGTLLLILGANSLTAQNTKYPIPDVPFKPYYFDEKNNEAVDMETGDLEDVKRTRGYGGIGTQESLMQISGEKSIVRITKKQKLYFLVKYADPNLDINKNLILLKLAYNPKTKARELVTMKQSSWSDKSEENYETIRFTNQKVMELKNSDGGLEGVVRLITIENLTTGEYVFMTGGWDGRAAQFFGVD